MSSTTMQQQSTQSQPAQQPNAEQAAPQHAATDMSGFSMESASSYQGSLGNQGVCEAAFGGEGGAAVASEEDVDLEAWDALITAIQIARGQSSDPSGPWSNDLFRMMCTLHCGEIDEEFFLSGEEAVKTAVEVRDRLSSAADKVAEVKPDWVAKTYQPAIDAYVVDIKACKIVDDIQQQAPEGGGSFVAHLDAAIGKASDLSSMMALAGGKTGETFVTTVVLPAVGEVAGESMRVSGENLYECLTQMRSLWDLIVEGNGLGELSGDDVAENLNALNEGLGGVLNIALRAAEANAKFVGDLEMAKAFGSAAGVVAKGVSAVSLALNLADTGIMVAKLIRQGGELSGEDWERLSKDAVGVASGIAALAGAATLATVCTALLVAWEASEVAMEAIEDLQESIILGMIKDTMGKVTEHAEKLSAAHDQALFAAALAGNGSVEDRMAYAQASSALAANMARPFAQIQGVLKGQWCRTLSGLLDQYDADAFGEGFEVASRQGADILEDITMTMEGLPDIAVEEAKKA